MNRRVLTATALVMALSTTRPPAQESPDKPEPAKPKTQVHAIAGFEIELPAAFQVERKKGDVLVAESPDEAKEHKVFIIVSKIRARSRTPVARALGLELGRRMMSQRRNGWQLRSRTLFRTANGFAGGRFDSRTGTGAQSFYSSYTLLTKNDYDYVNIEVVTRRPFSDWRTLVDPHVLTAIASARVPAPKPDPAPADETAKVESKG